MSFDRIDKNSVNKKLHVTSCFTSLSLSLTLSLSLSLSIVRFVYRTTLKHGGIDNLIASQVINISFFCHFIDKFLSSTR